MSDLTWHLRESHVHAQIDNCQTCMEMAACTLFYMWPLVFLIHYSPQLLQRFLSFSGFSSFELLLLFSPSCFLAQLFFFFYFLPSLDFFWEVNFDLQLFHFSSAEFGGYWPLSSFYPENFTLFFPPFNSHLRRVWLELSFQLFSWAASFILSALSFSISGNCGKSMFLPAVWLFSLAYQLFLARLLFVSLVSLIFLPNLCCFSISFSHFTC